MGSNPISIIFWTLSMKIKKLNILINFAEIRFRLLYCFLSFSFLFFVSFTYKKELLFLFSEPFLLLQGQFIYTGLLDPLIIYIKVCVLISVILAIPIFIYTLGFFFFKSLENNQIVFFFVSLLSTYSLVVFFCYGLYNFLVIYLLKFLLTFQESEIEALFQLYLQATIVQYYSMLIKSLYCYLFIILFPLSLLLLSILNIISEQYFLGFYYRKYFYLMISLVMIVFMPPDFFIQITIIPIVFLILEFYFFFITCYFLLFQRFLK